MDPCHNTAEESLEFERTRSLSDSEDPLHYVPPAWYWAEVQNARILKDHSDPTKHAGIDYEQPMTRTVRKQGGVKHSRKWKDWSSEDHSLLRNWRYAPTWLDDESHRQLYLQMRGRQRAPPDTEMRVYSSSFSFSSLQDEALKVFKERYAHDNTVLLARTKGAAEGGCTPIVASSSEDDKVVQDWLNMWQAVSLCTATQQHRPCQHCRSQFSLQQGHENTSKRTNSHNCKSALPTNNSGSKQPCCIVLGFHTIWNNSLVGTLGGDQALTCWDKVAVQSFHEQEDNNNKTHGRSSSNSNTVLKRPLEFTDMMDRGRWFGNPTNTGSTILTVSAIIDPSSSSLAFNNTQNSSDEEDCETIGQAVHVGSGRNDAAVKRKIHTIKVYKRHYAIPLFTTELVGSALWSRQPKSRPPTGLHNDNHQHPPNLISLTCGGEYDVNCTGDRRQHMVLQKRILKKYRHKARGAARQLKYQEAVGNTVHTD